MVKLRLKRMGSKFNAFYRLVATDSRSPRDGRFIEELGYYNPHSKELNIKKELVFKWLSLGAKPTETAKSLFKKEKIMEEFVATNKSNNKENKLEAKETKKVAVKTVKKSTTTEKKQTSKKAK